MRGLLIAAPASGQGKTTVTLGLLRALRDRGVMVASAKSGPDYIDPAFHAAATGRPCVTLDAWASAPDHLRGRAAMHAVSADTPIDGSLASPGSAEVLIVEGAMGAFDGAISRTGPGKGSAAEVAAALGIPMLLVIDVSHMAQSVGALVAGLSDWAKAAGTSLAGVILNRVGSQKHAAMVSSAIQSTCPVFGAIPRTPDLAVPSRHLGLVQASEARDLEGLITKAASLIAETCHLDGIHQTAAMIGDGVPVRIPPLGQRIAVAQDQAFSFAYWHMLQDWRDHGAEILPFSPLADQGPASTADAIFLPGGYPELHAGTLADAAKFKRGMQNAAERDVLIYGECGGYMVLGDGLITEDGARHRMLELLRLETSFEQRRLHLGYRNLNIGSGPWAGAAKAHEFHYTATVHADGDPMGSACDAAGQDLGPVGLRSGNVSGSFCHVIETA
ncbi:MAG: cobyrinate a,c-diamide synthase [Pseudomonadota bacterium]